MTSPSMGRQYIVEAQGRTDLVRLALDKGLWATVVREAQESVELFLKGALRLAGIEPARSHDVAEVLRREASRFPDWFQRDLPHLATISTEMAGDRGLAFYGDERQLLGARELFDEADARRALDNMSFVADVCGHLLASAGD